MNLNKAQLIGRIVNDPEIKALPSGASVAKFTLATNRVYKTKEGEKKETAQFHNCVAFGKLADIIKQWAKKGQEVYVDGRIEYRTWDKKDGGKGYITEIMIENFQMGAKARGSEDRGREPMRNEAPSNAVTVIDLEEENPPVNGDEDLPF
jgi:single-strand DNA-binding protein